MRVTSTVRSFIEKKVNEAIPMPASVMIKAEKAEKIQQGKDEFHERLAKAAHDIFFEIEKKNPDFAEKWHLIKDSATLRDNCVETAIEKQARIDKKEREKKVSDKIEEIIVTLELGGNKKDLDEMLSKLISENQ